MRHGDGRETRGHRWAGGALAAAALAGLLACRGWALDGAPVRWTPGARPYRTLSAYGLFQGDGSAQQPNAGVLPYDINTPLFSDYAVKHRFVWMPPGTAAAYDPEEPFAFPVGTILVKTFAMPHDLRDAGAGERILETRLLIHQPTGWVGLPYIWNAARTDAVLKVAGGAIDVEWVHTDGARRTNNYLVPNANQCKGCHENGDVMRPVGPKARNLNKAYPYPDGAENQLVRWTRAGSLRGAPPPEQAPRLAAWNDPRTGSLDERARAWLEANCMHCHNPRGPANTTGLDLRASQREPVKFGVFKAPVATGRGSGGRRFSIVPGRPDESLLLYRLESTDPGIMMPELGRRLVHTESAALIREWIATMPKPGSPSARPAATAP